MFTRETLASMPVSAIKSTIAELNQQKFKLSELWQESESNFGQRVIARKKAELDKVRHEYNAIRTVGKEPQAVVLELAFIQARERLLAADISEMESPKKMMESIDEDLELCHTMLESKGRAASTAR